MHSLLYAVISSNTFSSTIVPPILSPYAARFVAILHRPASSFSPQSKQGSCRGSSPPLPITPHLHSTMAQIILRLTFYVHICCPKNLSDALSESLMCFGASSTTIDEQDGRNSDEEIWIGSTFDVDQDVEECISRAANSVGLKEIPNYQVKKQDHIDWIKQTQESFHPVEITKGLWIVPEWRTPPDTAATNIILNPGLAFGTGEHPTTKLCLLLLSRLIKGGEYFLDYGTGSGVLAIAALKFGAHLSVGFDIEAQAITSARHNAALNDIRPEKLQLSLVPSKVGAQFESQLGLYDSKIIAEKDKYDVVIANILLHPVLDLADHIVSYGKPRATIAVSGIISEQVPIVMERYSQLLEDINIAMVDDWACISGSKIA